MILQEIKKILESSKANTNETVVAALNRNISADVYPASVNNLKDAYLFIGRIGTEKSLFVASENPASEIAAAFEGSNIESEGFTVKKCPLNHANVLAVQTLFEFTRPVLLGLTNSFGFGDRLGLANCAHIRSLEKSEFRPILAQQSIRELTRTQRKPEDVMDAAVWAVLQEGYKKGFGSDADHLKTTDDIDLMINAGFTMFTFDPGEYVINEADSISVDELLGRQSTLPWADLKDNFESMLSRYENVKFDLGEGFVITPGKEDSLRAIVKYGGAVAHIYRLYSHIVTKHSGKPFEIEVSVDETDSVTTPFEHFFIASELNRLGVKVISLAPRFIGDFEKGIDYKGDIEKFKEEYLKHVKITEYFGSYKISLHSGSDKFTVYNAIGSLHRGYTHVKTAGTSYLEALRVVAAHDQKLFREILDFSRTEFELEKKSYHVSANTSKVFSSDKYSDADLISLFDQNDARQVLHVTFGKVLTTRLDNGEYLFRTKIYDCLIKNEKTHYQFLYRHFRRHLEPFEIN